MKIILKNFFNYKCRWAIIFCFSLNTYGYQNVASKVIIAGVCKNVAHFLPNVIKNIEELGSNFADYAVIVYENNSDDQSAMLLKEWAQKNQRVTAITEVLASVSLLRTQRMADARNRVLEEARKNRYADFGYIIMIDLDFNYPLPISEIVNTIKSPQQEWDCVAANGIIKSTAVYWDRYAFRDNKYPFGPELLGEEFWKFKDGWFKLSGPDWLSVYSAFGGLAIYKTKSILPHSYSGTATEDLKKYYEIIISKLSNENSQLQRYAGYKKNRKKRKKKNRDLRYTPIIFKINTLEYQRPDMHSISCCEHVPLHASMALHGHGKFYVNPKMIYFYDLT